MGFFSCKNNCGEKFVGKVWYSKSGLEYSYQDNSKDTDELFIKVEKENDAFVVYYYDQEGKQDIDKFLVTCDDNVLKGQYNGHDIQMGVLENGNLLFNQDEIQSVGKQFQELGNLLNSAVETCLAGTGKCPLIGFLINYKVFKENKSSGSNPWNLASELRVKYKDVLREDDPPHLIKEETKKFINDVLAEIKNREY